MKISIHPTLYQQISGCVMLWGTHFWHRLGLLIPINFRVNAHIRLDVMANHLLQLMTTVRPLAGEHFQHDIVRSHKSKIVANWFMEYKQ